mgnify:CR=1 FL=1
MVITSLLHYNPNVEKIYLCLENDEWPYIEDKRIEVVNVSKEIIMPQQFQNGKKVLK